MLDREKAWTNYKNMFSDVYDESNYQSPLQAFVMRKSHKLSEKIFDHSVHFERVLEIGAGTGEHLNFIRHSFTEYCMADSDPKTLEVAKFKIDTKNKGAVSFQIQRGEKLSFGDNTFDRVIAIHVLEHINMPHLALMEWYRVLKHNGTLSIVLPTDPGFAWRLGRHLGPRRNALKKGIAYDFIMAREHVNSCINLVALLRHYFPGTKEMWWPFRIPSVDLNLFFAFHGEITKRMDKR